MTDNKVTKMKKSTSKNSGMAKDKTNKSNKVKPVTVEPASVEPVAVEPASVEPVAVEPTTVEEINTTDVTEQVANPITLTPKELLNNLIDESRDMVTSTKKMVLLLKNVCKAYDKSLKTLNKTTRKNKKRDVNSKPRLPSGFAKPTQISDTLCDFYGVPHGTLVSRTDITKSITQHIKKGDLQVVDNRRRFIPDNKLQTILSPLDHLKKDKKGITDLEKGYTYFNLQRYISDQFIKS